MVPALKLDGQPASERLRFVREFASAQDVKRAHPVVERTLDIIAGQKPDEPHSDVLQTPYAVTTDPEHRVFVTDVVAGKVHIFDFCRSKYSVLQDGGERLRRPVGVAADGKGNVYVTESDARAILVYDAKGKFRRYLKESRGSESYFEAPWGIAIDPATGRIYVCDSPRHMVIVLDRKGRVLDRFGKRGGGTGPGEFRYPTQVVASGGELMVLDSGNHRVQILDVRGHFRGEIKVGYTDDRTGLAVDNERNIYVTDTVLNRVRVFNHDKQLLYEFGRSGKKASEFNGASGMWVDSGHSLYVVDARNKRIQAFQIDGQGAGGCP
jgi:DNA-binding beta-propeller fold protein YncE